MIYPIYPLSFSFKCFFLEFLQQKQRSRLTERARRKRSMSSTATGKTAPDLGAIAPNAKPVGRLVVA